MESKLLHQGGVTPVQAAPRERPRAAGPPRPRQPRTAPVWGLGLGGDPAPGAHGDRGALGPIAFGGLRDYQGVSLRFMGKPRPGESGSNFSLCSRSPPNSGDTLQKCQAPGWKRVVPGSNQGQQGATVSGVPAPDPSSFPRPPSGPDRISVEHVGPIPRFVPELIALPTWKQQLPGTSLECSTPGV